MVVYLCSGQNFLIVANRSTVILYRNSSSLVVSTLLLKLSAQLVTTIVLKADLNQDIN